MIYLKSHSLIIIVSYSIIIWAHSQCIYSNWYEQTEFCAHLLYCRACKYLRMARTKAGSFTRLHIHRRYLSSQSDWGKLILFIEKKYNTNRFSCLIMNENKQWIWYINGWKCRMGTQNTVFIVSEYYCKSNMKSSTIFLVLCTMSAFAIQVK